MRVESSRPTTWMLGAVTFVLVVTALRQAQSLVIPVMVAVFVSAVSGPFVIRLQKRGVPWTLGVIIVVAAIMGASVLLGMIIGSSAQEFSSRLPIYEQQLGERLKALGDFGGAWSRLTTSKVTDLVHPGEAMQLVATLLQSLSQLLGDTVLIVLLTLFMLFDLPSLPVRLRSAVSNADAILEYFAKVAHGLQRYLVLKAMVSLLTGVTASLLVWAVGVDFPLLWGLLAFALNFVPNIGSVLAAIPPVALGLVQFGPPEAALLALGYVVINLVYGNVVEPRLTGKGLDLSTLVVFLSLVFWGWVFGPIGMLFSVPITMMIKIALEASPETRWAAVLLSSGPAESEPSSAGESS